jgi:lipoate-protein ligase A
MAAFMRHFRSRYSTVDSTYTDDELARAAELVRTKFSTPGWTNRVP